MDIFCWQNLCDKNQCKMQLFYIVTMVKLVSCILLFAYDVLFRDFTRIG